MAAGRETGEREIVKVVAPSTASATCLLADLTPYARVRAISHLPDGYELLLDTEAESLGQVAATVADWLRDCSLSSAKLTAGNRVFTITDSGDWAQHLKGSNGGAAPARVTPDPKAI